jgi:TolB protein
VADSAIRQVSDSGTACHDGDPTWSPEGHQIAFNRNCVRPGFQSGVYTVNPDGSMQPRLITSLEADRPTFGIDWSPDGSRVAFGRSGGAIYTMNADGTDLMGLTRGELDSSPTWSPDGEYIAFLREWDGQSSIWLIQADGEAPWQLAGSAHLSVAAFDWGP